MNNQQLLLAMVGGVIALAIAQMAWAQNAPVNAADTDVPIKRHERAWTSPVWYTPT